MATENDIVLIYFEDLPLAFARVESITPDRKKDWYHIRLLLLQVPLQTVTWILKDDYINGREFTMGGKRMRLEKVIAPPEGEIPSSDDEKKDTPTQTETAAESKIIPLSQRKPKS